MNTTDSNTTDDLLLEHIVELADSDVQEQLADLDLSEYEAEAVEALRLMGTLQAGVRQAVNPSVPDVSAEWQRIEQRLGPSRHTSLWQRAAAVALAAAAVAGIVFIVAGHLLPSGGNDSSYVAYVKQSGRQDIVLTIGSSDGTAGQNADINLSEEKNQQATGTTLSETGRLVLDYNNSRRQGIDVSSEVEQNTVTIPMGKEFQIVFADGTRVWLHADSRLTYPSRFTGAERRVYLQGEAYFDVAKDPHHPFVIYTDQMQARVLGTELNVSCYPGQEAHVALVTGKVQLSAPATATLTLQPGQGASLTTTGFEASEENMEPYLNWRKGYIYFDEAPLVDVVTELGRWYNVDVIIEQKELMQRHVRFFFPRNEPIERAIELLNTFHEFQAVMSDGKLVVKEL